MCVRMDRRAVYVGTPSATQRCPAHAAGRRRAILIDPQAPSHTVRPRLTATASAGIGTPGSGSGAGSSAFTGLGFDACATPSTRAMSAWLASPYRAIGVYIGGVNRACSQPNLTTAWVGTEVAAGWHLIPTYVGLQSPTSGCGSCAKLSANKATAQGTAAANDAVARAQSVGMGAGSPIYFDMEGYGRTSKASSATLTFLAAWTKRLHALGYRSGVYGSSASTIADLAGQIGFGYALPDDIWTANWNGRADTVDPYVPGSAWSRHQRLHQFRGGHNETYGGVRINIDSDYVDGATVGTPPGPRRAHRRQRPLGRPRPSCWTSTAAAPATPPARARSSSAPTSGCAFEPVTRAARRHGSSASRLPTAPSSWPAAAPTPTGSALTAAAASCCASTAASTPSSSSPLPAPASPAGSSCDAASGRPSASGSWSAASRRLRRSA